MTEKSRTRERIEAGRKTARSGYIPSVRERRKMLRRMLTLFVSHREAAYAVLEGDLGRSRQGAIVSEILPLIKTIKYLMRHLPSLSSAQRRKIPWINFPGRTYDIPEPYGTVLVAGSWNFPFLPAFPSAVLFCLPIISPHKRIQKLRYLSKKTEAP